MIYFIFIITFFISFIISYLMVPVSIKFAHKAGVLDNPNKDERRVHTKITPRVGGIAMLASMFFCVIAIFIASFFAKVDLDNRIIGYVLGALVIGIMGFVDDIKNIRAFYKFIFQVIAGGIIYVFGISIIGVKIPSISPNIIDFGIFAFPITLLWVLGVTNAINLIDGLDGLAAGVSSIAAIFLVIIFFLTGASIEVIVLTIALIGATLGFLPFNFNPAKTFMGDTGANFLGFTLSTVSIMGMSKGYSVSSILIPIIILGVPIFDMLFVLFTRAVKGIKMTTPDKRHVHHRLLNSGFSHKKSVLILYALTSVFGIVAIITIKTRIIYGLILLAIVLIVWITLSILNSYNIKRNKKIEIIDKGEK